MHTQTASAVFVYLTERITNPAFDYNDCNQMFISIDFRCRIEIVTTLGSANVHGLCRFIF